MPFDREATLRKAEKLVRQGKLDAAIADYRAVIDDQPSDWNTANTLGDLYFRAGQVEKAVAEYARIADHLATEGFLPKAIALYRKILKIKPDDEAALWYVSGLSARQGLLVDARAGYLVLVQRRGARGDKRGEAEARACLGDLDGADLETRLSGARARVELGDTKTAVERLKLAAADLQEKSRNTDALRLLTEAAQFDPEDTDLRQLLVQAYLARGDFEASSQFATTAAELKHVAEELFRQGREDEGINVLRSAAEADPADVGIRAKLARLLVARGDQDGSRVLLTPDAVGSDPELLQALAELELRAGRVVEGTAVLQRLLEDDPSRSNALVTLACAVAETNPDAGYECVDVVARAAIAADEWGLAAAALNEFVNRVPSHVPGLMRLVEICVDGGLEAAMHAAQAQLADAYLAAGSGLEARVIAEDLVAREPWEPANIERFRGALALLGEQNIDELIAERLSGQTPFTSTELHRAAEPVAPAPEVDLSDVLHELHTSRTETPEPGTAAVPIETVLKGLRDRAVHDESPETAEQHFTLAATFMELGQQEEAMKALEVAARSPLYRFRAGAMLAKAYLDAGDRSHAIEWYERAAEAQAPAPESTRALLYDLASVLEADGESARALAVLLELQAEAGEYRDVSMRLENLKVQMGT